MRSEPLTIRPLCPRATPEGTPGPLSPRTPGLLGGLCAALDCVIRLHTWPLAWKNSSAPPRPLSHSAGFAELSCWSPSRLQSGRWRIRRPPLRLGKGKLCVSPVATATHCPGLSAGGSGHWKSEVGPAGLLWRWGRLGPGSAHPRQPLQPACPWLLASPSSRSIHGLHVQPRASYF